MNSVVGRRPIDRLSSGTSRKIYSRPPATPCDPPCNDFTYWPMPHRQPIRLWPDLAPRELWRGRCLWWS